MAIFKLFKRYMAFNPIIVNIEMNINMFNKNRLKIEDDS